MRPMCVGTNINVGNLHFGSKLNVEDRPGSVCDALDLVLGSGSSSHCSGDSR